MSRRTPAQLAANRARSAERAAAKLAARAEFDVWGGMTEPERKAEQERRVFAARVAARVAAA